MPRIKAYKFRHSTNIIIPVDESRLSTAYRCPFTNEIFGTKKKYVAHLKELRKDRMHRTARRKRHLRLRDDLNNQPTFEKIIEWVENHPEFFFDNIAWNDCFARTDRYTAERRTNFEIKIVSLDVQWKASVSNSHNAPYNGVTNWGRRDENAPTGYPGWEGRITIKMPEINTFASKVLERTGINTGSGGGGGNDLYSYGVIFFDDDWLGLRRRREKYTTSEALGGEGFNRFTYRYGEVQHS